MNVFSLSIFGIGTIIGAGIYSVTGIAYGHAGGTLWISFILAGFAAVCTAFSYCELSTMYPSAGAEYIYIRNAFPKIPYLSFIMAMMLFFGGAAISSTVALAFAGYLQFFINVPIYLVAIGLMLICTLINNYGIEQSNRVNILFTFIELIGILLIIWVGFNLNGPVSKPIFNIHKGTLIATSLIFFIYLGFEEIVNLSEEARDPSRDIPKAIFFSLGITTVLYLAVSFAVIRLIRPEVLVLSRSPLADAVSNAAPSLSRVMAGIALFSTANTVLITMLVLSRMVFSMGREGDLPRFLGKVHSSHMIPHIASFFVLVISCGFLYLKNLEMLVSFSSFATLVAFISVNIVLIVLRYTKSHLKRPYLIPLNIGSFPLISFLGILICLVMCMQFEVIIYVTALLIVLISSGYYWGIRLYANLKK
ncbi:APC family permease [Bacteriovorax sp. PP10]|uniref:APC family permease n=1 Tax=Bacteriovorax antarcticus TaxID=3088717 RepID=A0ABU5VXR8_9BACT|nr:APC family permease [Bacteriovorax sp. PP10]MEA9357851.1 APC family permease [Bacteriovorax sp. PP10]